MDRAPAIAPSRDNGSGVFDLMRAGPDDFRAVLLSEFLVTESSGGGPARVRLTSITDGPADARFVQYSLTFSGGSRALPEGTHTFHHDQLGAFDLFVVPAPGRDSTVAYHACISRMMER